MVRNDGHGWLKITLWAGVWAGVIAAAAASGDLRHWRSVIYAGAALAVLCAVKLACQAVSRWAAHMALGDPLTAQRALRLAARNHEELRAMRRDMAHAVDAANLGPATNVTRPVPELRVVGDDRR